MALDREINDYSTKVISLLSDDERRNELAISTEEDALQCSTYAITQKMIAIYYLERGEWSTLAVGTHPVTTIE
jgi:hypothetical protein